MASLEDIDEFGVLVLVFLGLAVLVYFFPNLKSGFSGIFSGVSNWWNATQMPSATQQPGANLAGFGIDSQGQVVTTPEGVEAGGFGGGGTGAF